MSFSAPDGAGAKINAAMKTLTAATTAQQDFMEIMAKKLIELIIRRY
jgi:hypothetical protein